MAKSMNLSDEEMTLVNRGLTMLFKSLKRKADDETLSAVISKQYGDEMRSVNALQLKLSK